MSMPSEPSGTPRSFPLRLTPSQLEAVRRSAAADSTSLNHFIQMAIAEKIVRLNVQSERADKT